MPSLVPVIAPVASGIEAFDLWPVAARDTGWLHLHRWMTPDEVGMAVYSLISHSRGDDELPCTPVPVLRSLSDMDTLYGPGGLMVEDTAHGFRAEPGCCCDLFEWRDWLDALHGAIVDLGHGPTPWIEYRGDILRVWAVVDDLDPLPPTTGEYVDIARAALPPMLRAAQRDLIGFLAPLRAWVDTIAPDEADRVVAAVDTRLVISEPLLM